MGAEDVRPEWLDNGFLESVLLKKDKAPLRVVGLDVSNATGKGDNYLSILLRLCVHVEDEDGVAGQKELIVKTLPEVEFMRGLVINMHAFEKETRMYNEVLPSMYRLYEARTSRALDPLAPHAFPSHREHTLVLEDLKRSGYAMEDRLRGLDYDHACLVLEGLGRLHALSVALQREDAGILEEFKERLFVEDKSSEVMKYMDSQMRALARLAGKWPGYERFEERLLKAADVGNNWIIRNMRPESTARPVLNHGDCWVNNVLFCHEEGKPRAMRFIDFQISRRASPAMDLYYFLFTSVRFEDVESRWEDLMAAYLDVFNAVVLDMGMEDSVLDAKDFAAEMDERLMYALIVACTILVPVKAVPEDIPDYDKISMELYDIDFEVDGHPVGKSLSSPYFLQAFKQRLLYFEKKGIL